VVSRSVHPPGAPALTPAAPCLSLVPVVLSDDEVLFVFELHSRDHKVAGLSGRGSPVLGTTEITSRSTFPHHEIYGGIRIN